MWNSYDLNGEELPALGHASYRLRVKTSEPVGSCLGLRIDLVYSAYRVYINDQLVGSRGDVSTQADLEEGNLQPQLIWFTVPDNEFDVILHVSNFVYRRGGITETIKLGDTDALVGLHDERVGKSTLLYGVLLATAVFNIAIFSLRSEIKYTLYFSGLAFMMLIATDMVGERIIYKLWPDVSVAMIVFLWYSSSLWLHLFMVGFAGSLFPSKFSRFLLKFMFIKTLLFQGVYLITSPVFYSQFGGLINLIEILEIIGVILIVFIGRKGQKDSWVHIVATIFLFVSLSHDVLHRTNVITSSYGLIYVEAISSYILIQWIIQAKRIKLFHEQSLATELSFLKAQIKPHFIHNALNTIIAVASYDIDQATHLLTKFSNYLRLLIDDRDAGQTVSLAKEVDHVTAYVEIEKARFEERLQVSFQLPDRLDYEVPILTLQPIVENAIIHGVLGKKSGGTISVSVCEGSDSLQFKVADNGVGMTKDRIEKVFARGNKGIGLANINRRLLKLYGRGLRVTSTPGVGTEVSWSIPIKATRSKADRAGYANTKERVRG